MTDPGPPAKTRGAAGLWVVLFILWAAASSSLSPAVLGTGLVITGAIAWMVARAHPIWADLRLSPRTGVELLRYTGVFLREMVKSNLMVMRYVYAPRLDIHPGIVPTRTRLTTPLGRITLTNTVTLTPGTLVMGIEGETLHVHILDLASTDIDVNTTAVSGQFEPILARAFG
jgi:multicomponent Na+:H+ antiporter subunit E